MKKKILLLVVAAVLALFCFAACKPEETDPTTDTTDTTTTDAEALLSVDEYPRMDGSTANLPMMAEIMSQVCGITLAEAEELCNVTTTTYAWHNLANGNADILLVYEASEQTKSELATIGTELEIHAIGRDALVFINNEDNPVDNLTQQQLIDVYSGSITNWQDVGGEDIEIVAYQRDQASGSQSLFIKLLMQDVAPMDAPSELMPTEMGMLIDQLAEYNNSANALGFSVFYYASYMYQQPGLRIISVDGVKPSDETIADGSYPLLNEYYVAIRADEPEDSPARVLMNWILSEEGNAAMVKAGYIPIAQ